MRSSPKIKRLQLNFDQNAESVLAGIVSSEPDYKLSLSINRKLKISLKNISPLIASDTSGNELCFSRFSDISSSHGLTFDLISNRLGKNYLIRNLKNIDYLFQIHNPENEASTNKILTLLRSTESVTAVLMVDIRSLKDKNLHYLIQ